MHRPNRSVLEYTKSDAGEIQNPQVDQLTNQEACRNPKRGRLITYKDLSNRPKYCIAKSYFEFLVKVNGW